MQINSLTSYTHRITQLIHTPQNVVSSPSAQSKQSDSILISELGKRLSISKTRKTLTGGTSCVGDVASLMSKSLSSFEETLEKMHKLVKDASKDDLTALERIDMQIQFEDLRMDLAGASTKLNEGLAKLSAQNTSDTENNVPKDVESLDQISRSSFDNRKVLERAKDRLLKGEKWDVAEAWKQYVDPDTGEITGGEYVVLDGEDEREWTVHEKIKASGTVDLMSSASAKKGIKDIEFEMADVKNMREKFSSFLMSYDGEDLDNGPKLSDLSEEERQNAIQTICGIMYKNDDNKYNLLRPTNQLGFMFKKVEGLFRDTAGKLANGEISEYVPLYMDNIYSIFAPERKETITLNIKPEE